MPDYAQNETDALLKKIERKVDAVYRKAVSDSKKQLNEYLAKFKKEDADFLKLVKSGKKTQEEYAKWREYKILRGKQFEALLDTLATDYANADKIAMSIVRGYLPEAYAINRNYAAFQMEQAGLGGGLFTLYNTEAVERLVRDNPKLLPKPRVDIPKDKRWNKQQLRNQITQSILRGEGIDKVADRLQRVTDMDRSAAVRNGRTAITGSQNAGRTDCYKEAQKLGIHVMQEWRATLDFRTRHSHVMMDGERRELNERFSNGCAYPGDPSGEPEEVYNCRCTLVPYLPDYDTGEIEDRDTLKLNGMSYEEWKHQAEAGVKQSGERERISSAIANAKEFDYGYHESHNFSHDFWDGTLTNDERNGVFTYTTNKYEHMNGYLRGLYDVSDVLKDACVSCEHALDKAKLAEDTLLYRGMGEAKHLASSLGIPLDKLDDVFADNSIVGMSFVEKAFCSTGVSAGDGWSKQVMLDIVAPKGTNGMYVDLISRYPGEHEVLLQRGTVFEVLEGESLGYGKYRLKVVVTGVKK